MKREKRLSYEIDNLHCLIFGDSSEKLNSYKINRKEDE